eukprot:313783-Rhodomonas_salina.1
MQQSADPKDQHTKSNSEIPKQMQTPKPDVATMMAQIIQLQQEMEEQQTRQAEEMAVMTVRQEEEMAVMT